MSVMSRLVPEAVKRLAFRRRHPHRADAADTAGGSWRAGRGRLLEGFYPDNAEWSVTGCVPPTRPLFALPFRNLMTNALPILDLVRVQTGDSPCAYLPGETSNLEYRVVRDEGVDTAERLISRGWRRHGLYFFRPQCSLCRACRSLRVDVAAFQPSRSQRRCLRRNQHVRVIVQRPTVTDAHVELLNAYHRDMQRRRGWPFRPDTAEDYFESFLIGDREFDREFLYFDGHELIGVGLVDVLRNGISSVYFFHAPKWRPLGPGTFSILQEIQYAQSLHRRYNYLGYWIADCQSMSYKARFEPFELLEEYVDDNRSPRWHPRTF